MALRLLGKLKQWLLEEEPEAGRWRAPRRARPEVVVYYWDGSAPEGHHIRDVSQSGAYIYTAERWYVGTIIRVILQGYPKTTQRDGTTEPINSTCISARVVRHELDGVAVQFVFQNDE